MQKTVHSPSFRTENFPLIQISSMLSVNFTSPAARECFQFHPAAPKLGMLGDLFVWRPAPLWLQCTMAENTVHGDNPAKFPTKSTQEQEMENVCYKQIKIYVEYRDMLPRLRLDLWGTPGLRPVGFSPGFWQTNLGLDSMSRYSAHTLICIFHCDMIMSCQGNVLTPF